MSLNNSLRKACCATTPKRELSWGHVTSNEILLAKVLASLSNWARTPRRTGDSPLRKSHHVSMYPPPHRGTYFFVRFAVFLSASVSLFPPLTVLASSWKRAGERSRLPGGGRRETRRSAPLARSAPGALGGEAGCTTAEAPLSEPDISPLCGSEMKNSSAASIAQVQIHRSRRYKPGREGERRRCVLW